MNARNDYFAAHRLAQLGNWRLDLKSGEYSATPELARIFACDAMPPFAEQAGLFFSPENWTKLETANQTAISSGVGYDFDLPAHRSGGDAIWIQAIGEVQLDEQNRPLALRGTMQDISRRKRSAVLDNLDLGASDLQRRAMAATFENPVVGFVVCDATGANFSMNATAKSIFAFAPGHEPNLMLTAHEAHWAIYDGSGFMLPHEDWPLARALRGDFMPGSVLYWRDVNTAKESVLNWTTAPVYDGDGKIEFIVQTIVVGAETNLLHQQLTIRNLELERAKASADEANQAKSEFLSRMSHELRSPLHTILGFAQLIDGDTPPPTLAQTASVEQILKAGWYLLELINEILDLSQIESGNLVLSNGPTSLTEVLRECRAMVVPQGRKRGVHFKFKDSSRPFFVIADRVRLKQVLLNLLTNAIQYNRENGSVLVSCDLVEDAAGLQRIRVSISDTGHGIAPEHLSDLFQPFNRLDYERREAGGSGIGLVMSKRLIELMGGFIGVESSLNVGSTFWFELEQISELDKTSNLSHSQTNEAAASRQSTPLFSSVQGTVLYVEDNPVARELMQKLFASRLPNFRLLCASDGMQGVYFSQVMMPDVILMDIHLPGLNGIELLKRIQNDSVTTKIPVIALSAYARPKDISLGMEAGFFRYLTKPIKLNALVEALEEALEFISASTF